MPHDDRHLTQGPPPDVPPVITLRCEKRPGPTPGTFELVPNVSFTNMPGGWATVLAMLAQAQMLVVNELVTQARTEGERRIQVVPSLPGTSVVH